MILLGTQYVEIMQTKQENADKAARTCERFVHSIIERTRFCFVCADWLRHYYTNFVVWMSQEFCICYDWLLKTQLVAVSGQCDSVKSWYS